MATTYNLDNAPALREESFVCPYPNCSVLTSQYWHTIQAYFVKNNYNFSPRIDGEIIMIAVCHSCRNSSLWRGEELIYPAVESNAPPPNKDLPPEVTKIYGEAASIMLKSPRAAAGLLRLAIETLCIELECEGKTLQEKINILAKKDSGLQGVVEALDIVRIVGNAGVHVGIIEINDNRNIVKGMFKLINYAAERLITGPKGRKSIIADVNKLREESKNQEGELGRE